MQKEITDYKANAEALAFAEEEAAAKAAPDDRKESASAVSPDGCRQQQVRVVPKHGRRSRADRCSSARTRPRVGRSRAFGPTVPAYW